MLGFQNLKDTIGNISGLQQVPFSFKNQIDTVLVIAANLITVRFSEIPSVASSENAQNFTLSNGEKPSAALRDKSDPNTIRLVFAENLSENKELLLYAEGLRSEATNEPLITPAFSFMYDTRAPSIAGIDVINDKQLIIEWNEAISYQSAVSAANYVLENGQTPIVVDSISVNSVRLTFAQPFTQEKETVLSIKPVADRFGNQSSSTRKLAFTYDTRPPRLLEIIKSEDASLRLTFHEPLSVASVDVMHFELEGQNPVEALLLSPDSNALILRFANISKRENAPFSFKKISDKYGNIVNDSSLNINTKKPNLVNITARDTRTLELHFSQPMAESFDLLTNYSSVNQTIQSTEKQNDTTIIMVLTEPLNQGDSLKLTFQNIEDASGNALLQTSKTFVFDTYFESGRIMNEKTVELLFAMPLVNITSEQFLLNDEHPEIVVLDGKNPNLIRLFFEEKIPDNQLSKVSWQNLYDTYGRRLPDFEVSLYNDKTPPKLLTVASDFDGVIVLTFDEPLDDITSQSANLYAITGIGNPLKAVMKSDSVVLLHFENLLTNEQTYELVAKNVSDVNGNFLAQAANTFTYITPKLPQKGDIRITEIMADPTPAVVFPSRILGALQRFG